MVFDIPLIRICFVSRHLEWNRGLPMIRDPLFRSAVFVFTLGSCLLVVANAQSQVAATPPMGWNSWNHFAERVTDADVRAAADAMVSNGMREAGYVYVNVDDTWEGQ